MTKKNNFKYVWMSGIMSVDIIVWKDENTIVLRIHYENDLNELITIITII